MKIPVNEQETVINFTRDSDIGKSPSFCQRCTHMKHGLVTIGEDTTISGENSYCDASKVIWLFKNEAVVMCSKFQEEKKNEVYPS